MNHGNNPVLLSILGSLHLVVECCASSQLYPFQPLPVVWLPFAGDDHTLQRQSASGSSPRKQEHNLSSGTLHWPNRLNSALNNDFDLQYIYICKCYWTKCRGSAVSLLAALQGSFVLFHLVHVDLTPSTVDKCQLCLTLSHLLIIFFFFLPDVSPLFFKLQFISYSLPWSCPSVIILTEPVPAFTKISCGSPKRSLRKGQ